MITADELRSIASKMASLPTIQVALNQAAERIDELTTMNRLLNLVGGAVPASHTELDDIRNRLTTVERQLPHFADIELTIGSVLKNYGYPPRG